MSKKIFITGATGFVGSEVLNKLVERGFSIKVLVRDKTRMTLQSKNVEPVEGDVLDKSSFSESLTDVDAVIHLVGIIREFPSKGITFEKLHFNATKNVVDAALENNVPRFVHMSANGARESAVTDYHKSKYKAEEYVKNSGLNYTVLKPSLIYGPNDSFINMLKDMMKKLPVFSYFGKGDYKMQPVSVYEVADIFVRSIDTPATYKKTYSVCGNKVFTYRQLLLLIMKILGIKRFLLSVPESFVDAGIAVFGSFSWFPLTKDQFQMLKEGNICNNDDVFNDSGVEKRDIEAVLKSYLK